MNRVASRVMVAVGALAAGLAVSSTAAAADLDQTFCESSSGLNGTWTTGPDTCTVPGLVGVVPNWPTVTVPSGVTLVLEATGNVRVNNVSLTIDAGGRMVVAGPWTTQFATGAIMNSGTIDVTADALQLDLALTNYGTIKANSLVLVELDGVPNNNNADNYGLVDTPLFGVATGATWTNHCNALLEFNNDIVLGGPDPVDLLDCSIAVTITPAPTSGDQPLAVTWTVTLANDGDDPLTSPAVALSTDGGSTTFATLVAPPTSGDAGTVGTLDPGETWTWTVGTTENADVTVTATGAGTSGLDVITYPGDPEARAAASVTVTPTTTTTTTTTPATTTPVTSVAPTTIIGLGGTLPATGTSSQTTTNLAVVAGLLVIAGGVLLGIRRRA